MTRQQMRQLAHRKRMQHAKKKEEETLYDKVIKKHNDILDDPYRRHWNKYDCWNYRTVEGLLKDVEDGWIFEVKDGHIYSINNPKVDSIREGVEKISYEEYVNKIQKGGGLSDVTES